MFSLSDPQYYIFFFNFTTSNVDKRKKKNKKIQEMFHQVRHSVQKD